MPPTACTPTFRPGASRRAAADRLAGRAAVAQFYRIPKHDDPDTPALELLGILLGQGQTGRLTTVLSRDLGAATSVQGGILGTRQGPGAFALFAVAGAGVSPDSLAGLLAAQATWAASDNLTEADLTRAKNIYRALAASTRERPQDLAEALQHAVTYHGAPDAVNTEVDRVLATTLADLRRVAAAWLRPDNALTLVITPGGAS